MISDYISDYISADVKMMAVKISRFQAAVPRPLFDVRIGIVNPQLRCQQGRPLSDPAKVSETANVPITVRWS